MTPPDDDRLAAVTGLFLRVVDLEPRARERILDRECRDAPELRRRVEMLLAHDQPTDALQSRVLTGEPVPERLGPYLIRGRVGSGGMGHVYDAWQESPIARRVAIKVVRPSLSTERVLARFRFERQSLARMEHPNIARILDAGTTDDGAPYFVMEYVDGTAVCEYCDRRALSIAARLDLFLAICAGIEHAHQRGVIHRDVKPGNVLVTDVDGRPVPKIIDFGIARAVEGDGTTRAGEQPGTPGYMSPEQQAAPAGPIDTRTDVFSLGVLLYELLTGIRPAPGLTSADAGWIEPSRAHVENAAASADAPTRRGTTARALTRELRGDLDWIVWRAMRRRPDERYPAAAALAADLARHRARLPVEAHPARVGYRVRRFARRHWVAVALAAAAAIALGAFAGASAMQAARVRRERDVATLERDRANESEARARRILAYMTDMFGDVDPELARGSPPTAEQMLERGARSLDELEHDPIARAWLQATIGRVYARLGAHERAEELLVAAVAAQRERLDPRDPERAHALNDLGALYVDTARFDEARPLLEESLSLRDGGRGDDDRGIAQSLNELGRLAWEIGDLDAAERHYREALATHERAGGPDSYDVAVDLVNVSNVVNRRGRFDEGEAMLRRALTIFESAGIDNDLHLADCLNNLGIVARRLGRPDDAIEHLDRATRIRSAVLGADHPDVAMSLTNLGSAFWSRGDLAQARLHFERGLEIRERVLPADHPHIAFSINALAVVHKNLGDYEVARALYERGLEIARGKLGDEHPDVARILGNLGNLEREDGRPEAARRHYDRALAIYLAAYGPEHPDIARLHHALGSLAVELGRYADGEARLQSALTIRRSGLGERHPSVAETLTALAECHRLSGDEQRARAELEEALDILEATRGPDHLETAATLHEFGELLLAVGRPDEATPLFDRAATIRRERLGPDHPLTRASRRMGEPASGRAP